MDITNIPQNIAKALEQKNTDQLVALSRELNLVVGKVVVAHITATTPVTVSERAELQKQTNAALAQINQQADKAGNFSPALKAEEARLIQQQNLLKSPDLKWVSVVVNNRPLLTYSDRPLLAGQNISMQLQNPQKLVLLNIPDTTQSSATTNNQVTPNNSLLNSSALNFSGLNFAALNAVMLNTKNAVILNEVIKNILQELTNKSVITQTEPINIADSPQKLSLATQIITDKTTDNSSKNIQQSKANLYAMAELSLKLSNGTENSDEHADIISAKKIIGEQLRNLLSFKDTPKAINSLVIKLQELSISSRAQLFSPNVEQALKNVAAQIRPSEQLTHPKILAQALKNSGVFLENKLSQNITKNSTEAESTQAINTKLNTTFTQDLKGSLLNLVSRTTQDLAGSNTPVSSEQILKLFQNITPNIGINLTAVPPITFNNQNDLTQAITILAQQLMSKPVKELSDKELRTQLLTLLQQHSLHGLAKIQLQQLHTLSHELDIKDSIKPNTSWQLEIPVRHQNEAQLLHLRIDREWIDEKDETESNKNTEKIKQWSVILKFDLPTLGDFCAQLTIINTQVSATLWAAQEKTFVDVRDNLNDLRTKLENEGIKVNYLQCMQGMPPEKPMALSYSLIDVST